MNFLMRRGSKKSLVKTIHLLSEEGKRNQCETVGQDESNNLHQPETNVDTIVALRENLEKARQEIQMLQTENEQVLEARIIAEDQANYFENLMNEREAEILSQSTRIETLTFRNNELGKNNLDQLYETKTEYTMNLEVELKKVKEESAKTAAKLHRKVKKLKEIHGKSKQEYALEIFALKTDNNKLQEENEALHGRLQLPESQDSSVSSCSDNLRRDRSDISEAQWTEDETANELRSKLIVQLSQQVTTLDVENEGLKKELDKANALLNRLRVQGRTCSLKSSEKYQQQLCVNMASLDLVGKSNSEVELCG